MGGKADLPLGAAQGDGPEALHGQIAHHQLRQDRDAQLPPHHDHGGVVVVDIQPGIGGGRRFDERLADVVVGTLCGDDEGVMRDNQE